MKEIVSTSLGGTKYKRMNLFANIMFIATLAGVGSVFGYNYYEDFRREEIYDSLHMSFSDKKEVEYGSKNSTLSFVTTYENGEISDYTQELDTKSVGIKELKYEITNDDVSKEYTLEVVVKDTKVPKIKFKYDTIILYVGNTYTYNNNVKSVKDVVDGELPYLENEPKDNKSGYYTISTNLNNKKTGIYKVTVKAVDKNGNVATNSYNIKVINRPVVKKKTTTKKTTTTKTKTTVKKTTTTKKTTTQKKVKGNYNGPSSVNTSSVVKAAKSLLGSRYTYAGSSPSTGFDCSGFVSYIYRLFGKNLSRTASGIANNGKAVSESNMKAGDIIVWSNRSNMTPTHVSLYIGNGQMIHAANRRLGVVQGSVSGWKSGGRNRIISIRRV
jgi:cell wall-associated NlpC family hydrolase